MAEQFEPIPIGQVTHLSGREQKDNDSSYQFPVKADVNRADCIDHWDCPGSVPLIKGLVVDTCPKCFRGYIGEHHVKWHPLSFPPENRNELTAEGLRMRTGEQLLEDAKLFRSEHPDPPFVLGAGTRLFYHEKCLGL